MKSQIFPRLTFCFSLTHVLLYYSSNCNSEKNLLWTQNIFYRFWKPWSCTFRICKNIRDPKYKRRKIWILRKSFFRLNWTHSLHGEHSQKAKFFFLKIKIRPAFGCKFNKIVRFQCIVNESFTFFPPKISVHDFFIYSFSKIRPIRPCHANSGTSPCNICLTFSTWPSFSAGTLLKIDLPRILPRSHLICISSTSQK